MPEKVQLRLMEEIPTPGHYMMYYQENGRNGSVIQVEVIHHIRGLISGPNIQIRYSWNPPEWTDSRTRTIEVSPAHGESRYYLTRKGRPSKLDIRNSYQETKDQIDSMGNQLHRKAYYLL